MKRPAMHRWRFSLKTLLLAVAGVSVLLGLNEQIMWLVLLPLELAISGMAGQSWAGYFAIWLATWYLEQIHKTLGNTPSQRWLVPAKWGMLLLTIGATHATIVTKVVSRTSFDAFPNGRADYLAIYFQLIGFFVLVVWVPRRLAPGRFSPSEWFRRLATFSLMAAIFFGPLSTVALTIRLQFEVQGLDGLGYFLFCAMSHCVAAAFLGIYAIYQVYVDRLSWPFVLCLIYTGLAWALLIHG